MFFALIFVCNRLSQITTLIPVVGMLGWLVNKFSSHNALTPDAVLVLFIVSTLALSWAVITLFSYHRSSHNAMLVGLVDVLFVGALVTGIWFLRGIRHATCDNPSPPRYWVRHVPGVNDAGIVWDLQKPCAMLKASWAFAIINSMLFILTSFAAYLHGDKYSPVAAIAYDESIARARRSGRRRGRSHRHGHQHQHQHQHQHRHRRSRSADDYSRPSHPTYA